MSARDWLERRSGGPAQLYDRVVGPLDASGLAAARTALVGDLTGAVLELGCGTGGGFDAYPASARVTAVEPEPSFRHAAFTRAAASPAAVTVEAGDAHDLRYPDASFDAVVASLMLCSVARPQVVLAEAARVLRAGGEFRVLEHVRHSTPLIARLQDAVDPLWASLEGRGCRLGRDTPRAIREAGFELLSVDTVPVPPGVGWLFPIVAVRARRPASAG